jgi:hypothetical protein
MANENLEQLIASNARAVQAMLDAQAEDRARSEQQRREHEARMTQHEARMTDHEERILFLEALSERLAKLQEGMTRMLASIDEERPTVLRKLNSIENKLDRILDLQQD